jgi:Spy/CpxP family protein refolding chaperone
MFVLALVVFEGKTRVHSIVAMFAKLLFGVSTALLLTASGFAQAAEMGTQPSAVEQTRAMTNRLQLNEGQYIKIASINRIRVARQAEIERTTTHDPSARTAQLEELQMQFEQECARILTPSQLSLMQQDQNQAASNGQG